MVYDLDAQHFIIDNLEAILGCERGRTDNQGQPWLPEHDEWLKDLYAKGVSVQEIAVVLKRNGDAVRKRLRELA